MDSKRDDILINENGDDPSGVSKSSPKGWGKKITVLLGGLVLIVGVGGYFGYTLFFQEKGTKGSHTVSKEPEKMTLIALEPFILNLFDPGRHLKVAIQLELKKAQDEGQVKERTPKLRDIIILLLSSKTVDSVSSPEGKFQLKDEILLRANQALGKELFKNVYFTEFVMQ